MTPDQLNQCAEYFVSGDWTDWVIGGITIGIFVYTALTKHSIPSFVKKISEVLSKSKDDKIDLPPVIKK